jgi:hypothetical protein
MGGRWEAREMLRIGIGWMNCRTDNQKVVEIAATGHAYPAISK